MTNKKAQFFTNKSPVDIPITGRELKRLKQEEMEKTCVAQAYLLDRKIVSLGQVRISIKEGQLTPIHFMGKKYFKKDEVAALLERIAKPTILSQPDLFEK